MGDNTRGNRERSPLAPSLAFSRASPYLLLLAPVAFVLVGKISHAFPWAGTGLSIVFALAIVMVVRNASRGGASVADYSSANTLPEIDWESLGVAPGKFAEGIMGMFLIVLIFVIMRHMTWPTEPYSRLFSWIGWFFGLMIGLGLTFGLLWKLLDDLPGVKLIMAACAGLYLLYVATGLFRSSADVFRDDSNAVDTSMADIRHSGDRERALERLGDRIRERDAAGNTLLHGAARGGDFKLMEMLLAKGGFEINARNASGETPFMLLVKSGFAKTDDVQRLIDKGADLTVRDGEGRNLLEAAVDTHKPSLIHLFLDKGVDPNVRDQWGMTAFTRAVQWQSYDEGVHETRVKSSHPERMQSENFEPALLERMIAMGADVKAVDKKGRSVLFHAYTSPTVLRILVKAGADVNVAALNGDSYWSEVQHQKTERILAAADLFPDIRVPVRPDGKPGRSPLHVFADRCDPDVVAYFLKRGLNPNEQDEYARTTLHVAMHAAGSGSTPCTSEHSLRMARLLVEAGGNVNARTFSNVTPLMEAAGKPQQVLAYLLAQGADVNTVADVNFMHHVGHRQTALDWARQQHNEAGVRFLLQAGAKTGEEIEQEGTH